jgi:hypothetical protein
MIEPTPPTESTNLMHGSPLQLTPSQQRRVTCLLDSLRAVEAGNVCVSLIVAICAIAQASPKQIVAALAATAAVGLMHLVCSMIVIRVGRADAHASVVRPAIVKVCIVACTCATLIVMTAVPTQGCAILWVVAFAIWLSHVVCFVCLLLV